MAVNNAHTDSAARLTGDELLPCGRLLSRVWEQARDAGPSMDRHSQDCRYCRQAIEGLTALSGPTSSLGARKWPTRWALADRVMNTVRAEMRPGTMLPLDEPTLDLRIAETAAARVLRRAADAVPGARAVRCRLTPAAQGTEVKLTLTLAVVLDHPLPDRAAQVHRSLLHSAHHALGLAIDVIDLQITEVLEPPHLREPRPATRPPEREGP